jgi:mannose-1-phosphate guanylyltransferase / phosphomannomutase
MVAVIISEGKGIQLKFKDIPKPMVRIDRKPVFEYQISLLSRYGIKDINMLTGYLSAKIESYFSSSEDWEVRINYYKEHTPLGTAGALKELESILNERFLVLYSDVMFDLDIDPFRNFDDKNDSIAAIVIHPNDHPFDSDLIETDENNNVIRFLPKPHQDELAYQNMVSVAIYILSHHILNFIEQANPPDFGKDVFSRILKDGRFKIKSYNTAEFVKDAGASERFLENEHACYNKRNKRPAIFIDRDGVINEEVGKLGNLNQVRLLANVLQAVTRINASEYLAIVVTNQPGIAKRFLSQNELMDIHKLIETILGKNSAFLNKSLLLSPSP